MYYHLILLSLCLDSENCGTLTFFPLRNMNFEPWHHLGECISYSCHEVNCYDILCEEFKPDFA